MPDRYKKTPARDGNEKFDRGKRMKQKQWQRTALICLICAAMPAQAGLLDFLSGGETKLPPGEAEKPADKPAPALELAAPEAPLQATPAQPDCPPAPEGE